MTYLRQKSTRILSTAVMVALLVLVLLPVLSPPGRAAWDGSTAVAYAGGTGTAPEPYQINTEAQLAYMASRINSGFDSAAHFKLTAMLDLDGTGHPWTPIGTAAHPFSGYFNGDSFSITDVGLSVSSDGYTGLFGLLNGATVNDLTVASTPGLTLTVAGIPAFSPWSCGILAAQVIAGTLDTVTAVTTNLQVSSSVLLHLGGIAGDISPTVTVTGCSSSGSITVTAAAEGGHIGGLAGLCYAGMTNCSSSMAFNGIASDGWVYIGGLIGQSSGNSVTYLNCQATGLIQNIAVSYSPGAVAALGGLIGYIANATTLTDCAASETISIVTTDAELSHIGGLVGITTGAETVTIAHCTATGNINTITNPAANSGDIYVGGFIGYNTGIITSVDLASGSSASGNVTNISNNNGSLYAGGFIGCNSSLNQAISYCIASGNVTGISNTSATNFFGTNVGGFVGAHNVDNTITHCQSSGNVSASSVYTLIIGGFAGHNTDVTAGYSISDCTASGSAVTAVITAGTTASVYAGGFAGLCTEISNCTATASVTVTTTSPQIAAAGGFAGSISGAVDSCTSSGSVSAVKNNVVAGSNQYAGGFVGYVWTALTISNSHATGLSVYAENGNGNAHAGGFVGFSSVAAYAADTSTCNAEANGSAQAFAGGFAGRIPSVVGDISFCTAAGTVRAVATTNSTYTGGFVAYLDSSTLKNCQATGDISFLNTASTSERTGGFVGYCEQTSILDSTASGSISGITQGAVLSGGFVGLATATSSYTNCSATGDVGVDAGNRIHAGDMIWAGGFVGADNGNINSCRALGAVHFLDSASTINAGGFTGSHDAGDIVDSFAAGSVSVTHAAASNSLNIGGFAGQLGSGNIKTSYSSGLVTAINDASTSADIYAGGFAGRNTFSAVENCYAAGSTTASNTNSTATSNIRVGGFIGQAGAGATILNCYTGAATVSGTNVSGTGTIESAGFIGNSNAAITDCYYLIAANPTAINNYGVAPILTGLTTSQLQNTGAIGGTGIHAAETIISAMNSVAGSTLWTQIAGLNNNYPVLNTGTNYTVSFNTNGGNAIAPQIVASATAINAPAEPTKQFFTFGGWYTDVGLSNPAVFPITINATTVLHVKWRCTAAFNTDGGSAVTSQVVDIGSTAAKPSDPSKSGFTFAGWWDETLILEYTVWPQTLTANRAYLAKWVPSSGGGGGSTVNAPILTGSTVIRQDKATAIVTFSADAAGQYYYVIVKAGVAAPDIDTAATGDTLSSGTQTINITALATSNAYDLYIVSKAEDSTLGTAIKIAIPENNDITEKFSDIGNSWSLHYTQLLYDAGIRAGYPDATIRPDQSITKAELAVLLVRALNLPIATSITMQFNDMASIPDWAKYELQTCVDNGILKGSDAGDINASAPLTRHEAAVMLVHAFQMTIVDGTPSFTDTIPDWAKPSVNTLVAAGVISGYPDGSFSGSRSLSNGELNKMLCVLLNLL